MKYFYAILGTILLLPIALVLVCLIAITLIGGYLALIVELCKEVLVVALVVVIAIIIIKIILKKLR